MDIIELKGVSEQFKICSHARRSLKGYILDILRGKKSSVQKFSALHNINLTIKKSEVVGIIGENGSGKTTLLKLIAGILMPDKGSVNVKGRVSSLLELGAAFHPELTGRENIYLNGAVLGLSKRQIDSKLQEIIKFSELEKFIDSPLKAYSAGMCVRLGFAIAINVNPEILLIDEVLVVGDESFQKKCLEKIKEFKERGKTIVFVSHNMDIVSRLCERAIFLRGGEIIEDGQTDEAIGLYMQTVGEKKGIGIIKKNPLDFIFNNGKCILCWNGKILTKGIGGCVSLKVDNNWYTSTQAEWEIQNQSQNEIVVFGHWINLPISQEWKISLENNNFIKWDIKINVDEDIKVTSKHVMLMLSDKYRKWITPFKKGDFPEGFHSGEWENIPLTDKTVPCTGVGEASDGAKHIPSIIFDFPEEEAKFFPFILNSNFSAQARALQARALEKEQIVQPGSYHFFSGKICVYNKLNDMYIHLNQIAEKKARQLEEERRKRKRQLEEEKKRKALQLKREMLRHTIKMDNLKIIFKDSKCRMFWQEKEFTGGLGIYTSFSFSGNVCTSNTARWDIKKIDESKMVAVGKWSKIPMSQIWHINLKEGNCIDWKVELELNAPLEIAQRQAGIMVLANYKKWIYSKEEGKFPEIYVSDKRWAEIVRKKIGTCGIIGVRDNYNNSTGESLPSIMFDFSDNEVATVPVILNTEYVTKARVLCFELIDQSKMFSTGKYLFFSGKIFVNAPSNTVDFYIRKKTKKESIEEGSTRLIFDKGRGRLFWQDIELTKNMGLYTSLRSQNIWHDSTAHASWELKEVNDSVMVAQGKWNKLPISQLWKIELKDENSIQWTVEMQLDAEVKLEREQTNIMLKDDYKKWLANNQKGMFPEGFNEDFGGDWESMWKGSPKLTPISVDSVRYEDLFLPPVTFDCSSQRNSYIANIVNSDKMFKARLLQCLRVNEGEKAKFAPCNYRYFSGTIKIINT